MRRAHAAGLVATALASVTVAGCSLGHGSGAADEAGGSTAPTTLRLAVADSSNQPGVVFARYFAKRVEKLSGGALRVDIKFEAAGDKTPEVEQRTVGLVSAGRYDLGWVGARAWDKLGVKSFEALQAPFLVTSDRLLDRVVNSGIGRQMLDGLRGRHMVGLALLPDELRHPVGLEHPLVSLADFSGARIRIQPSRVTGAVMRALRAVPKEVSNAQVPAVIDQGKLDAEELSLGNAPTESTVTANVTFFGKAVTLFAGERAFRQLSARERGELREAARETVRQAVATSPTESALATAFCRESSGDRIVLAGKRQLAELARAVRPVYAQLDRNPQTKAFIARIRSLKSTTRAPAPLKLPAECTRAKHVKVPTGKLRNPGILNGTYHVPFKAGVDVRILWNGRYQWGVSNPPPQPHGAYTIRGDHITFLGAGSPPPGETFVFSLDDGVLRLKPVPPMDPGDAHVTAGEPWVLVGPASPIR